ncbi:hypothetical protein [Aeromonas veronii]|uniref:hypothetical protein n=1 Tax=Aeromonas veronii TaxID=654 RepID=UPI003BA02BB7
MINKMFFLVSMAFSANSYANQHKIIGVWEFKMPDSNCFEVRDFRNGGVLFSHAADQQLESKYIVYEKPSSAGFYKMEEHILKDNGGHDCLDMPMPDLNDYVFYLKFSASGNELLMCLEEKYEACLGPYVRRSQEDTSSEKN